MTPSVQNRDRKGAVFSTYLITFVTYGTWLPGEPGAVSRRQNLYGSPLPEASEAAEERANRLMKQPPYVLDERRRQIVLASIQEVCAYRAWTLMAVHVRTNHVHVVVAADTTPERVMNTLKAHASRALNTAALDPPDRRRWAHHGSTRHLWGHEQISAAIHYVVCEQGKAMAAFEE